MELSEYQATYARFIKYGPAQARFITDQIDADRIKANRKEAKRQATEERMRELIREELTK